MSLPLFVLASCSDRTEVPPPRIDRVDPTRHTAGETETIRVEGAYFINKISRSLSKDHEFQVRDRFSVTFHLQDGTDAVSFPLGQVKRMSNEELTGNVPEDILVGTYRVSVKTPLGLVAELDNAFTVVPATTGDTDTEGDSRGGETDSHTGLTTDSGDTSGTTTDSDTPTSTNSASDTTSGTDTETVTEISSDRPTDTEGETGTGIATDTDSDTKAGTDIATDTDSDTEAETDTSRDTGTETVNDAGMETDTSDGGADTSDGGADAGSEPDSEVDTAHACEIGGVLYGDICWFLGELGQSCQTVCDGRGGTHPDTPKYIGSSSQGGSQDSCAAIFEALGYAVFVATSYGMNGGGLGCYENNGSYYWRANQDFDQAANYFGAARVCGCAPSGNADTDTDSLLDTDQDVAYRPTAAMVVDGMLNEAAWNPVTPVENVVLNTSADPVLFDVLWDESYLYVGVAVEDESLHNDSVEIWNDDSVAILVDGNHSQDNTLDEFDDLISLGYGDDESDLYAMSGDTTGIEGAWSGSYTMEFAIPWSHFGVVPSPGMTIGFDIGVNDDDGGGDLNRDSEVRWVGTDPYWWTSTTMIGDIILVDADVPR